MCKIHWCLALERRTFLPLRTTMSAKHDAILTAPIYLQVVCILYFLPVHVLSKLFLNVAVVSASSIFPGSALHSLWNSITVIESICKIILPQFWVICCDDSLAKITLNETRLWSLAIMWPIFLVIINKICNKATVDQQYSPWTSIPVSTTCSSPLLSPSITNEPLSHHFPSPLYPGYLEGLECTARGNGGGW